MTLQTLRHAYHALQQRRVREWPQLSPRSRAALRLSIDEVRREMRRLEAAEKEFEAALDSSGGTA
jgi:hypothetical protein